MAVYKPAKPRDDSGKAIDDQAKAAVASAEPEPIDDGPVSSQDDLDLRMLLLMIICSLLVLFTLYAARAIIIPIALACILNLVLSPFIRILTRWRVPEPLGAAIVMLTILVPFALGIASLVEPATEWLRRLPLMADQLGERLDIFQLPLAQLKAATEAFSHLGSGSETSPMRVVVEEPAWSGTLFTGTSQILMGLVATLALLYFLLAMGDTFLRKLVTILPHFRAKKQAVEIAHQLQADISHYLLTVTLINIGFGAAVAAAMYFTGMPNPLLWGTMAAFANFVPFLGHALSLVIIAVVSLLSIPDLSTAFLPPLCFLSLALLEGNLITPMILARRLTLNPVAVVGALLVWGWMWGIVGLLLAVPILVVSKITADRLEPLRPIGEFLGH